MVTPETLFGVRRRVSSPRSSRPLLRPVASPGARCAPPPRSGSCLRTGAPLPSRVPSRLALSTLFAFYLDLFDLLQFVDGSIVTLAEHARGVDDFLKRLHASRQVATKESIAHRLLHRGLLLGHGRDRRVVCGRREGLDNLRFLGARRNPRQVPGAGIAQGGA